MRAPQVLLLIPLILTQTLAQVNHIVKESSASASSSSAAADDPAPVPAPAPAPAPVPVPPVFPGVGFGKGFGLHKSLDFNIGAGGGAGAAPFAGLFPGLFGGAPGAGLGVGVPPPGAADVPIPTDPGVGGLPVAGPGYLGTPFPFLGPSYVPYSWLGSALGAKGDLLFPVVIFLFVVVGIWTVVQFLLGLIVPLIAAKFEVGEHIIKAKGGGRAFRSLDQMHEDRLNSVTAAVMDALEKTNDLHQHTYGIPPGQQTPPAPIQTPPTPTQTQDQQNQTGKANATEQNKHPLFSAFV